MKNINIRDVYGLPDGDIDERLEQFRKKGFTRFCRKNKWRCSFTKVLNNDGTINEYKTWTASFRYINKWNLETEVQEHKIITDNNMRILWIGIDDDYYFISVGKAVYGYKYVHKNITLFPNISSADEYFSEENMVSNDQLIIKYKKNIGAQRFGSFDKAKYIFQEEKMGTNISIAEFFEKGFFYKGKKWNKYYEYMYPKDITILVSIQVKDNLFYIEIENITYPFHGYMLLDLNKFQITEAKKIESIFDKKISRASEISADVPQIGIFWLALKDGKIEIFHSEPITLEFGQDYGSFIVAPREHYNTWESLRRHKIIPDNSNYEDLPRGRVAYNKHTNRYVVFHGNYIKSSPGIKAVIKSEFNLKSRIRWEPDLHYHKFKCWGF